MRNSMPFVRKYFIPPPHDRQYARAKAQAKYRKEDWAFTPESWLKVWVDSGLINQKGHKGPAYVMIKLDKLEAWGPHNCKIVSRYEQLSHQGK